MMATRQQATPEVDDRPPPTNVVAAIARVMADLGGVEKLTPDERKRRGIGGTEQGVSYAFRGIDQIAAAAQPLLAQYGVVIVPSRIIDMERVEVVRGNPPRSWAHIHLQQEWKIYGPGGVDDMILAETTGEGLDNSDKTHAKAITVAFKNLLLKLLCIGDPSDDGDRERHEQDDPPPPKDLSREQEVAVRFSQLNGADKQTITRQAKALGINNVMRSGDGAEALNNLIDVLLNVGGTEVATDESNTEAT